jgi:hypothetical protein
MYHKLLDDLCKLPKEFINELLSVKDENIYSILDGNFNEQGIKY